MNTPICDDCYGNVLGFNKFISKIIEHQKITVWPKHSEVLKSYKGITIKKIHGGSNEKYPLFETVEVKCEPMEMETCLVKCEPVEMEESSFMEEASNFGTTSEDDDDDSKTGDDEFSPTEKTSSSVSSMKKVADLNFTCANCKISYDDFEQLTQHITSRVSRITVYLSKGYFFGEFPLFSCFRSAASFSPSSVSFVTSTLTQSENYIRITKRT